MTGAAMLEAVILRLVGGDTIEAAEAFCVSSGAKEKAAKKTVAAARARITVAADYARDEQIGKAFLRLEDLYAKSVEAGELQVALQAQRELNRLLALYADARAAPADAADLAGAGELRGRLDLIARHLVPLGLAPEAHPVEEHARLAADIIRKRGGAS